MAVPARALTEAEIEAFNDSLWFWEDWLIPPEGRFFYSQDLGGYVLVFPMQDGSFKYILTDNDYNAWVPDKTDYYNKESWDIFWNKAHEITGGAIGNVAEAAKNISEYIPWIVAGLGIYFFREPLQAIFKKFTK